MGRCEVLDVLCTRTMEWSATVSDIFTLMTVIDGALRGALSASHSDHGMVRNRLGQIYADDAS